MAKTSLHHLTRKSLPWRIGLDAVARSIQTEDDRTAAIIAATTVDVALERAIKTKFRALKNSESDTIFSGTGPLSTFSAKIHIGYALGIIGPKTKHDFTTIKDIRNVFAHSAANYTFRTKRLRDRCFGMHIVQRNMDPEFVFDARGEFLSATHIFWFLLHTIGQSRTRVRLSSNNNSDLHL